MFKTVNNIADKYTNLSVGMIVDMKTNACRMVKYKILYKDYKDRQYAVWSNWMRDDGYRVGDSIPMKNITIPSFGLLNMPLEVNNHPQKHVEPYIVAMVAAGIAALVCGYNIGKSKN